jgi:transcriptional regulator with XRE-family HTH domain
MTQLAQQIRALRTAKNLSQDGLAEKLYISRQAVSKWENGEATPDIDKLVQLAEIFDVSLDYYKALLRTIRRGQFIDEHILGISKEKYSAYIEELEGAGYIKKVEPDAGISGYILTTKGNNELKKKGEISFVKELNIQPQIGLINIQNSVSGSVF